MARIVCCLARDDSGDFFDPISGNKLRCVAQGADIEPLVQKFKALREAGVAPRGKNEVRLSEIRLLANHTAGGEFKAGRTFQL